jgi:hypothetical protein
MFSSRIPIIDLSAVDRDSALFLAGSLSEEVRVIYARLYREFCRRFGYWPWLLTVVLFAALILWRNYQKDSLAEAEKELALETCSQQYPDDICREEIESRHGACFDFHYTGADIYGSPRFDRAGYRACLKVGFEEYIAEVRETERLERAARDALYN